MQMKGVGIYFNYKKECQRNWQLCTAIIGLTMFLLMISSFLNTTSSILFVAGSILEDVVLVLQPTVFNILMYSLYQRFFALNSYLRWVEA